LVTRDELRQRLWPADTYGNFADGLNAAVKRLRQALNDSAGNPRFVETLPRLGYRFIAPVQIVDAADEGPNLIEILPAELAPGAGDLPEAKGVLRAPFSMRSGFSLVCQKLCPPQTSACGQLSPGNDASTHRLNVVFIGTIARVRELEWSSIATASASGETTSSFRLEDSRSAHSRP
jgi:hypothetical protein